MTGDWSFRIFPRFFLIAAVAAVGCALLVGQLRPGTKFSDCDGCPEMIVVPPGSFTMGVAYMETLHIESRSGGLLLSPRTWSRDRNTRRLSARVGIQWIAHGSLSARTVTIPS